MEKIIFFDEQDGSRIDALLNPESLSWRRSAGVRSRLIGERPVMYPEAREDTLIFTGGGVTDIDLNLLFDTRLLPRRPPPIPISDAANTQRDSYSDVRDLTQPLWALTEAQRLGGTNSTIGLRPQLLIWGEWSVRVVFTAIAERFEEFNIDGMPRRAWLSISLRRVETDETATTNSTASGNTTMLDQLAHSDPDTGLTAVAGDLSVAAATTPLAGIGRPDLFAHEVLGDARLWPLLLDHLGIEDPLSVSMPPVTAGDAP